MTNAVTSLVWVYLRKCVFQWLYRFLFVARAEVWLGPVVSGLVLFT